MVLRASALVFVFGCAGMALSAPVYLALGDSIAYGLQPDPTNPFGYNVPSFGDRGYVAALANALSAGGPRPTVVNLSLPGESSTSFFDTSDTFGAANSNYGLGPFDTRTVSQAAFANGVIAMYGPSITTVSFALGANDFLSLQGLKPLTPGDVADAFANITSTYTTVLAGLKTALPNARIVLPGYYDPYYELNGAPDPRRAVADPIIKKLNLLIQGFAAGSGSTYVDFYTPIDGNQATLIYPGDIHPSNAGYGVLGRAAAQAVPEPSVLAALGLGAVALVRRRRG